MLLNLNSLKLKDIVKCKVVRERKFKLNVGCVGYLSNFSTRQIWEEVFLIRRGTQINIHVWSFKKKKKKKMLNSICIFLFWDSGHQVINSTLPSRYCLGVGPWNQSISSITNLTNIKWLLEMWGGRDLQFSVILLNCNSANRLLMKFLILLYMLFYI